VVVDMVDDTEFGGGYRAHHYAAYQGHLDICQMLYQAGAKVRRRGRRSDGGGGGGNDWV